MHVIYNPFIFFVMLVSNQIKIHSIQLNKITLLLLLYLRHPDLIKTHYSLITVCRFPETASLCSYLTLQEYLSRTESSRVAANTTKLFLR